jgi:hypothetical protein
VGADRSLIASLKARNHRGLATFTRYRESWQRRRAMNRTDSETPIVRTTTEAREGVTGHNVRYVLLFSTVSVIVIFAALWLYYFQ